MEPIIQALSWREATKKFDTDKKLTESQLGTLLEAARLSPSSYGLQPWSFVVVTDPEVRKRLREFSWDQPQVTDASHLFVFAAKIPSDAMIDEYIADIAATRGIDVASLMQFEHMMKSAISGKSETERLDWAKRQVYLALGVVLTTAATLEINACPMEGFDAAKYDEILGLTEKGLHATVIAAFGFRNVTESVPVKVRFPKTRIVLEV